MVSEKSKQIVQLLKENLNQNGLNYNDLNDLKMVAENILEKEKDDKYIRKITKYVKECCLLAIKNRIQILQMDELYWETLRFEGRFLFESFMIYMEKNRPQEEKFYENRIKPLKQVADAVQDLYDDLLDELFINCPSRIGKTAIVKFAFLWWGSVNTELSNLYTAYSDKITTAFYTGLSEMITDTTYTYGEIFPENRIVRQLGDDEIIDLNRKKTYPTFTCRSIYGTLNGSCDCNGLAVADDLLSGIEEALSMDRLDTVWGKFDNNFMKRLKRKAKLINMGTRWAIKDPQGRRRELLETKEEFAGRRYRVISIPALDENDESNFDYPYNLGYSTEDYKMIRASFEENDDMASWFAQDQQQPIERQGALFESGDMNFFRMCDLPQDREPDRIFMAVDEAYGGGDFVSAPICYQFDSEYYIVDAIFDPGDKKVTRPRVAEKILFHKAKAVRFEETKATTDYHEWIEDYLKTVEWIDDFGELHKGYRCNITWKAAQGNLGKRARIFDKAPEIREMHFLVSSERSKEYQKFMQNIFSFKMEGKVKHDDGPDSMAQLCDMKLEDRKQSRIIRNVV